MSNLETAAQRVLTPLILDEPGTIALEDQAAIATWVQKTALTAMLLSSKEQRENGYGLAPSEYRALYERRELVQPLDFSQFWVGRFEGVKGFSAVRVTPLTVRIPGFPEPPLPQGYAMTIVLGALLLHGVRFTTPGLQADTKTELGMPPLWPSETSVMWPAGQTCTEKSLLALADGGTLRATGGEVRLQPWSHAAHLPQSDFENGAIKVPALCRKHDIYYPAALLHESHQGRFYAFMTSCECSAYLIRTDSDRIRFRAAGEPHGRGRTRPARLFPGSPFTPAALTNNSVQPCPRAIRWPRVSSSVDPAGTVGAMRSGVHLGDQLRRPGMTP
ncbi:hypothetical protein [Rhodococcus sp. 27YEA15]|uniref:hypothetical protein n=1 Tax=Rhodococcus sp. 27YEA15 TaxID=3156259 RepID=UPI003C7B816F